MENFKTKATYFSPVQWSLPNGLNNKTGLFQLFRLAAEANQLMQPVLYKNNNSFVISLFVGAGKLHYADRVVEINHNALVFTNSQIPIRWESKNNLYAGFFCTFNQQFFHQFGNISKYEVFKPVGANIFDLAEEEVSQANNWFSKMLEELGSDYQHKYDVIRTLIFELLHFAMRTKPKTVFENQQLDASQRISSLFFELLEHQFPVCEVERISFRTASDFADQLHIHVNHLNRSVKKTTQKTTSQIIAHRVLQEAKILLRHSSWSVSEIGYALGYTETTHFNNFFKKHTRTNPLQFRNA